MPKMPKKKKTKVTKSQPVKISKDLVIGIAIGAIVIFVFCLMMLPGGQGVDIDR